MYIDMFWIGFVLGGVSVFVLLGIYGITLNRKNNKKNDKNE